MNLLNKLRTLGTQDNYPAYLNNKVAITNIVSVLVLLLVAIPFIFIALLFVPSLVNIPVAGVIMMGLVLVLNYLHNNTLSRYIATLSPAILALCFTAYLTAPGELMPASLTVMLLAFSLIPFVIFDPREKLHLTINASISGLLFVFKDSLANVLISNEDGSVFASGILYQPILVLGLIVGYVLFFSLSFLGYRAEQKTQQLIEENKQQTEDIRKSEELLKQNLAEVQKAQEIEKNRAWVTEGLGRINTLIRNNDNHEKLAEQVIAEVVKYLGANQGVIYLVEMDDSTKEEYMEIKGAFAFGKKKGMKDRVRPGEGLIGQCYLEKDVIYLTDVPSNFVKIKSGLGDAPPRNVIIFPLIANDKIEGIIEIASFEVLPEFKIDYLKKLGENLASSFNLSKINYQTKELLELSQQQQEEMRSQAEELQQNMEELQATQEEMERKSREVEEQNQQLLQQEEELKQNMEEIMAQSEEMASTMREMEELQIALKARELVLNTSTIMSEADLFGTITYANDKLSEVSQYSQEEMIGKGHNMFRHPDMPKALFKLMWDTIKSGQVFRGVVKNRKKDGNPYWVDATIAPVMNDEGKIIKYIGVRYHIVDEDVAQAMYDKQMEKLGL
jgi:PAS domain S-box-containing protein